MSENAFFNMVYWGTLLSAFVAGIAALFIAKPRIRFDFPIDKLKSLEIKFKKGMVIGIILIILMLVALILLYVISPKSILLIQYIILFFTFSFTISTLGFLLNYRILQKTMDALNSTAKQEEVEKVFIIAERDEQ